MPRAGRTACATRSHRPPWLGAIESITGRRLISVFEGRGVVSVAVGLLALILPTVISVTGEAGAAGATTAPFVAQVNFQNKAASVPSGYVRDYGLGYSATAGFGWVQSGTSTPVSMVGNGKNRHAVQDPRLDTLMVVKGDAPPQWVMAVPNGTYDVTVSVGDANLSGKSRVVVNGTTAINSFRSTTSWVFERVTVRVDVTGGFVVLDAAPNAGTSANARWDYVDIAQEVGAGPHQFTSVVPANGAEEVSKTASVTLTTSAAVDPTTLSADSFQLLDHSGNPVSGSFSIDADGQSIDFTPSSPLAPFSVYSIQTTDGLRGIDGVPFVELTSSFETAIGF